MLKHTHNQFKKEKKSKEADTASTGFLESFWIPPD